MSPEQRYLRKCTQNGVIIDTNLLALLLIGLSNPTIAQIRSCTRTSGFDIADFRRVLFLANQACEIVVTPQILAEVANITFDIRHMGGFDAYFKQAITFLRTTKEDHREMTELIADHNLEILGKVGFADTSVARIAKDRELLVLTDDGPLTGVLTTLKIDTLNVNYLKSADWLANI